MSDDDESFVDDSEFDPAALIETVPAFAEAQNALDELDGQDPAESEMETFDPDSRILGLILKSVEGGKTTLVTHPSFPELRIFPDNGWFVFSEELDSYPEMFREPAEAFSIEVVEEEIKSELINGRLPQSLWKLLFTAALFGSKGRLLNNLSHRNPFHLVHTPYFGMIPHTTDHIKVADFMVTNNESLETIATETEIEIETVIDFCNACDAIQLLQNGSENVVAAEQINADISDATAIENDTTQESEMIREPQTDIEIPSDKKTGLINSIWSNFTKTS
ncbi:MAG: hypothetical protein AB8D52_04755 [Gammaproteobacteria bacterium]